MAAGKLEKRALLIGPTYDHLPDINQRLKGTLNDVALVKDVISKPPFNFRDIYIKEVTGSEATHNNILTSFKEICDEAPRNSVVFIYYSGHGCTLKVNDYQYDEGLVPYDATYGNISQLAITGHALAESLEKLAEKKVATTVIFDCCYSGHMYRTAERDDSNSSLEIGAVKQVDFGFQCRAKEPEENDEFPYAYPTQKTFVESWPWQGEGWKPTDSDKFFFFSACNSQERAYEAVCKQTGKTFGLFTHTLANILKNVAVKGKEISYEVLYSLIRRDFLQGNIEVQSPLLVQTPQHEGGQFGTVVFDVKKVELRPKTIVINKVLVISKEVEIGAGKLQLMNDGEYDVFEADVTEDGLQSKSKYWLGTVDVNQGGIDVTTCRGCITDETSPGAIKAGCVIRLNSRGSMRTNVVIVGSGESAEKMRLEVDKTKMFNVRGEEETDREYVLAIELVEGEECWCARLNGQMTVPPAYPGEEALMAENMAKAARYQMVRQLTLSPNSQKLHRMTLKIVKIDNVERLPKSYQRHTQINQALKNQDDLYKAGTGSSRTPTFKAHDTWQTEVEGKKKMGLVERSGDGLVVRVTNDESHTVYICILFLQLDGSIVALYPKRQGLTTDLLQGRDADELVRMYIPPDALRLFGEPDPTKPEPKAGLDIIMLLAATEYSDFGPLLQSPIVFGGAKGKEKSREGESVRCDPLNPLEKFRMALTCRNGPEPSEGSTQAQEREREPQWLVMKRAFWLEKPQLKPQ